MRRNKLIDKLINNAKFSAYYEHFISEGIIFCLLLLDLHVKFGPSKWLTHMIIHLTMYPVTGIQTYYLINLDRGHFDWVHVTCGFGLVLMQI